MAKKWAFAVGILGILTATPAAADRTTERYTSITVFGDSLVDAGNLFVANGGTRPDPATGYFQNRFTNGYDYPDLLSIDLFGAPTTPSLKGGANYAFGGARIVDTGDSIPDLQAQIDAFKRSPSGVDSNGLYILNFGGNDVFGAKGVFGPVGAIGSYPDISSYLRAAAQQYVGGIQELNDLGARNILFTDFPMAGDPLTIEANGYLNAALKGLTLSAGTDLFQYSLNDLNRTAVTDPASLGLPPLRFDTNCVAAGAQSTGCVDFFSFDGVHVTAAVQAAGYKDMDKKFGLTLAQSVPEPQSWIVMILGFGIIGSTLRYRRSKSSVMMAR